MRLLDQSVIHLNNSRSMGNSMTYVCLGECLVSGKICVIKGILIDVIADETVFEYVEYGYGWTTIATLITLLTVAGIVIVSIGIFIPIHLYKSKIQGSHITDRCICCKIHQQKKEEISLLKSRTFKVAFNEKFERDGAFLGDVLDAEHGLIGRLFAKELLTPEDLNEINKCNSWRSNDDLVSQLVKLLPSKLESKQQIKLFMEALKETNQTHVFNYLINKTGGKCRPLRDYECRVIQRNSESLVHLLETTDAFLTRLVKKGCITEHHSQKIRESAKMIERNEKLLMILKRRSYRNLIDFKKCLKGANLEALIQLLERDAEQSYADDTRMCAPPEGEFIPALKHQNSTSKPARQNTYSSDTESAAPDTPLLSSSSTDSSADMQTTICADTVVFDHISNKESTQNINLNRNADQLYPVVHCVKDDNENYVEVSSEDAKHRDAGDPEYVFMRPTRPVSQRTIDTDNQNANSDIPGPNYTTDIKTKSGGRVHFPNYANEGNSDSAWDVISRKPRTSRQLSGGSGSADNKDYKPKHYALISSKTSSDASELKELFSKLIRQKFPDYPDSSPVSEYSDNKSLDDAIINLFKTRNAETLVIVFTGDGSSEGLKFQDGAACKLDDILGGISKQHTESLDAGYLPNHVTVMFIFSYGHCYDTAKKYKNSMNVIACTDSSTPEIRLDTDISLFSTILRNIHSPQAPRRTHSILQRLSSIRN